MMRDALAKSEVQENDEKKKSERQTVVEEITTEIFDEELEDIDDFEDNFAQLLDKSGEEEKGESENLERINIDQNQSTENMH